VQRMLLKHLRDLRRIYKHYAQADSDGESDDTLNIGEFLMLLNDCGALANTDGLTQSAVVHLFMNLQDDELMSAHKGIKSFDEIELHFEHFLEGLCGCAIYKYPDPYMPIVLKVHHFITQNVVKALTKS
jgi:hypothetical protein